ncbi:chorismate mutase [Methanobrevibacter woesei]|uniref:Chorismate mutase n=1 Tax=Methanobrevibacter woesei TaxID=190976 RepID=A0A2U1S8P6_9EURY|nr:chorismate mutase [Methanobrevibacter woesei]PWB86617.1 chorismate mutase [Methanobrevibacter woesei]
MNEYTEYNFKNEDDARNLLEHSRQLIDDIDNELVDLISRRTSLAKDIVSAKVYLGMEIYDKNREKSIHDKVDKLAIEKNIDKDILNQIIDMLAILSKNEQRKILRRHDDGKY